MTDKPSDAEIIMLAVELGVSVRTGKGAVKLTRAALEKWGTPAPVGAEPVALLVRKNSWRDGQWEVAPPNSPSYGLAWANQRVYVYATPQPTQPQAGAVPLTCEWTHNEDDGFWETACGEAWRFDDGGPGENNMHFCHSCGNSLRIKGGQHGTE